MRTRFYHETMGDIFTGRLKRVSKRMDFHGPQRLEDSKGSWWLCVLVSLWLAREISHSPLSLHASNGMEKVIY